MNRRVVVLGRQRFLNRLLVDLIRDEITPDCVSIDNTGPLVLGPGAAVSDGPDLILVDDADDELKADLDRALGPEPGGARLHGTLALFNVDSARDIGREVAKRGVRGVFYVHDELESVLKGLQALLSGDVWIPRRVLANAVASHGKESPNGGNQLTRREMEILLAVSTGATNDEIAQQLFVSSHTVKTHLYNIYRKLGVPNRLHAARWAMTHTDAFLFRPAPVNTSPLARLGTADSVQQRVPERGSSAARQPAVSRV